MEEKRVEERENNFVLNITVTDEVLKMEISLKDLVELFLYDPYNEGINGEGFYCRVAHGKEKDFAKLIKRHLEDEGDPETGQPLWSFPFSEAFSRVIESAEDDICEYQDY